NLQKEYSEKLLARRPHESAAAWGFRWLLGLPNVKMILSGMSNLAQMQDNVKTFSGGKDLTEDERNLLLEIAEPLKQAVPCTACRYCVAGCPKGLNIPFLISVCNDLNFEIGFNPAMQMDAIPKDKWPDQCIACGKCKKICPQNIDVPVTMKKLVELLEKAPKWVEICKERAAVKAKK
ncbi:MAG: 4Fe-4S binding protein, partial [Acidaminococcaceae bacterium]|nr:4Fe-4S binding protein [Acidaminococcaceae bacterium]